MCQFLILLSINFEQSQALQIYTNLHPKIVSNFETYLSLFMTQKTTANYSDFCAFSKAFSKSATDKIFSISPFTST